MKKAIQAVQTEVDASYLYQKLAEHEPDSAIANIFRQMSEIERSHAETFLKTEDLPMSILKPSWRAKTINLGLVRMTAVSLT